MKKLESIITLKQRRFKNNRILLHKRSLKYGTSDSPCSRFHEIMNIAMHYFTIEPQCIQLHDNATYFMHYNSLKILNTL